MTNKQKVLLLYKAILKLHRGLPVDVQKLGNDYVREEFKRHKILKEGEPQINIFMWEWTSYAINLAEQLGVKSIQQNQKLGKNLEKEQIEKFFNDEQLHQLHELYLAAKNKEEGSSV